MTASPPGTVDEWVWLAAATRTHLTHTHRHLDTGGSCATCDPGPPPRFRTLCRLGPHHGTELRLVDSASPPECRICLERWARILRHLDRVAPVTLGEVATWWPTVVARVRADFGPVRASLVRPGRPVAVGGRRVTVALPGGEGDGQSFYLERLTREEDLTASVAGWLTELLGVPVTVHWVAGSETSP